MHSLLCAALTRLEHHKVVKGDKATLLLVGDTEN